MKKLLLVLLLTLGWLGARASEGETVRGRVLCDGRGVEGVWVSDGVGFARTDKKGAYTLPTDADSRFVFVCVPAGYDAPVEGGVVRFHHPLPAGDAACDFTLLRRTGDDRRYNLAVIADPQIWFRKEFPQFEASMEDLARTVRSLGIPVQGLCCGDITAVDHDFYGPYNEIVARTGIPFRYVMGNHDMTLYGRSHECSFTKFEATYGPCYYSFDIGRIHYVMLNDNFYIGRDYFYIGYLDERQLRWLERDLAHVEAGRTVVVCLHIPTSCEKRDREQFTYAGISTTMTNHPGLYRLLEPYNAHILSGHTHTTYNQQIAPRLYEHVIPALSGAWWQGELCTDGTPAGYALFEIEGDSIRWHYRSTGRPADYQIRLYDGRQTPQFAGYAVANIWASDPSWRVEFFIDGVKCGEAERFEALDPDAQRLYGNKEALEHSWIEPTPADHFYRVPLPDDARRIEVVATDRFGQTSRAVIDAE
ncbi:MAG TPA: calcineurin-like phosphoesterase family protein [Candidatus Alistipes stercoravium]|nr:calcineurin-like phosphoesterase family protein [Candidatus Alistipes stercoravium]